MLRPKLHGNRGELLLWALVAIWLAWVMAFAIRRAGTLA